VLPGRKPNELHRRPIDENHCRPDSLRWGARWIDDLLPLERRLEVVDLEGDVGNGLDRRMQGVSSEYRIHSIPNGLVGKPDT
jgi:hypothetical protein